MFGVLNINKPSGLTSRDVVNRVQRLCPERCKVGHAGTLDPMATGVLVIGIGPATKLIRFSQEAEKGYVGGFRFGFTSDTEDITGEVVELENAHQIKRHQLEDALTSFVGEIQQVPPQYSAVKVNGKRAYALARSGQHADIKARPTHIHSLKLLEFDPPDFELEIFCGKGTYVRTLGRDICKSLGSDSIMTSLRRIQVGNFRIDNSIAMETLTSENIESQFRDPRDMLFGFDEITMNSGEIEYLRHGKKLRLPRAGQSQKIAAINSDKQLLAVLRKGEGDLWGTEVNFVPELLK